MDRVHRGAEAAVADAERGLAFGTVLDVDAEHVDAGDRAVRLDMRNIAEFGAARAAVAVREDGLRDEALAGQRAVERGAAILVDRVAEHFADGLADHRLGRDAEPLVILRVGETVDVIAVDVRDQHRHGVGDAAQFGFAGGEAVLGFDAAAIVDHRAQDAADRATGAIDGRVEQVERQRFRAVGALEQDRLVAVGDGLAAEACFEDGAVPVPHFGEGGRDRAAERGGVAVSCDGAIAVVVEHDVLGAPHHDLGDGGVEDVGERDAEFGGPRVDRAERRRAPVALADEHPAFAAADQDFRWCGRGSVAVPHLLERGADDGGGVAMPSAGQFVDVAAEVCGQGNGARRVRRCHAGLVGIARTRVND